MVGSPELILLFCGKRKSGKDYITDRLHELLGDSISTIVKISHPIKSHWATASHLSLEKLLSAGDYKEQFRLELIRWSEEMRAKDPGCFCRLACGDAKPNKVWIVSDIRRRSDLKWFSEEYPSKLKTIKITANEDVRIRRGMVFTPGVDDAESECDLDQKKDWDFIIDNSAQSNNVDQLLHDVLDCVRKTIS